MRRELQGAYLFRRDTVDDQCLQPLSRWLDDFLYRPLNGTVPHQS